MQLPKPDVPVLQRILSRELGRDVSPAEIRFVGGEDHVVFEVEGSDLLPAVPAPGPEPR